MLNETILFYLPRDWMWSLGLIEARSHFLGTGAEWRPSGMTRLGFPIANWEQRRLGRNASFVVGTENFGSGQSNWRVLFPDSIVCVSGFEPELWKKVDLAILETKRKNDFEAYWQDEKDWLCIVEFLPTDDPEARLFAADIICSCPGWWGAHSQIARSGRMVHSFSVPSQKAFSSRLKGTGGMNSFAGRRVIGQEAGGTG